METPAVSRDDLLDVLELTDKMEEHISQVLNGEVIYLAMPALIAATIKCILSQCESLEQAKFYRDVFMTLFEEAFKGPNIKSQ